MNDINNKNDNKESDFKVYKEKLNSFISNPFNKEKIDQDSLSSLDHKQNKNKIDTKDLTDKQKDILPKTNISFDARSNEETIIKNFPPNKNTNISANYKKKNDLIKIILKTLIITFFIILAGYIITNFKAIYTRYEYWKTNSSNDSKWSDIHPITLQKAQNTAQKLDENYLYIPTLGIQAPIHWGIEDQDITAILSSGLVHYNSSNLPDDAHGNIYIIGNTSGPIWSNSKYKNVFTLLDKSKLDQVVTIIYKNKIYSYRIVSIKYFKNSQIDIFPGYEKESKLYLMARFPIGVNSKTLLVGADLFKIESNIIESVEDKIDKLQESYHETGHTKLNPIEVDPEPKKNIIPTENKIPNPELLPQNFLPKI